LSIWISALKVKPSELISPELLADLFCSPSNTLKIIAVFLKYLGARRDVTSVSAEGLNMPVGDHH